jgi:GTPase SAR1 family protein
VEKKRGKVSAEQKGMQFFEIFTKTNEGMVEIFEVGVRKLFESSKSEELTVKRGRWGVDITFCEW